MLYSKLVQGETRKPRHSDVEQQEEGRRSSIAAIAIGGQRLPQKMVLAVGQHHERGPTLSWLEGDSCESAAGQRRAASARSRCPGGDGRWGDGASSPAGRQSKEGD